MSHALAALRPAVTAVPRWPRAAWRRWAALAAIAAFALTSIEHGRLVVEALSEAYLAVAVFVAGTLAVIYGLEQAFKRDLGLALARHAAWQVPAAALLGAVPGCGGAIVMVTQYIRGNVSFGAMVATLTATMGDAMFLLLAKEPATGLLVFGIGLLVGVLSGYAVDALHGRDFLRPAPSPSGLSAAPESSEPAGNREDLLQKIWLGLIGPGLLVGLIGAFQINVDALLGAWQPGLWLGLAGAVVALAMWARSGYAQGPGSAADASRPTVALPRIIADTNFITAWVVFAFLAYEIFVALSAIDLAATFAVWAPLVPLAAVAVGFLPGCGPQILVTALYVTGSLPLSAQLANAISNDGDALFPAIALVPRAALVATLYSALPALLVGYGAYLLGY